MKDSKIEWTHHSWNPWIGCTRVSPGCRHCYAETMMADRYKKVKWGPQGKRVRTSAEYWRQPIRWNREAEAAGERRRVFCASLADVFEVKPDQAADLNNWRLDLSALIRDTPWLDWLILTKRPENVKWDYSEWPQNIWIGTSVETQEYADRRIPELLKIPAAVRFLSVEPMLGPVDLTSIAWPDKGGHRVDVLRGGYWNKSGVLLGGPSADLGEPKGGFTNHSDIPGTINWVIVGGESGPNARPMHPKWAADIRDQCQQASVPFFFKQNGTWISKPQIAYLNEYKWVVRPEWKEIVSSTREWGVLDADGEYRPETTTWNGRQGDERDNYEVSIYKVGKHRAGRLLDGREWNEFPVKVESSRPQGTNEH